MMLARQANSSADQLYRDARIRWAKAVRSGIYDNEDMICRVIALLEQARQQNPDHVRTLALLSDLLMELGAADEAMDVVDSLLTLQPQNRTYVRKKALLRQLQSNPTDDNREAMREFVEARWTTTNDW